MFLGTLQFFNNGRVNISRFSGSISQETWPLQTATSTGDDRKEWDSCSRPLNASALPSTPTIINTFQSLRTNTLSSHLYTLRLWNSRSQVLRCNHIELGNCVGDSRWSWEFEEIKPTSCLQLHRICHEWPICCYWPSAVNSMTAPMWLVQVLMGGFEGGPWRWICEPRMGQSPCQMSIRATSKGASGEGHPTIRGYVCAVEMRTEAPRRHTPSHRTRTHMGSTRQ